MGASEHKIKYLEDLSSIDLPNLFTDDGRKAIHESETGYGTALVIELRLLDLLKKFRDIEANLLKKLHELNQKVFEHHNNEIKVLIKQLIWLISFKSTEGKAAFDRSTGVLWLILIYYNIEKEEYILSNELEHLLQESEIENLVRGKFQSVINDANKLNLFLKSELKALNLLIIQVKQQLSLLAILGKLVSVNAEKAVKNYVQVLIIGGGLAGISTAYHLTRANVQVMVVEAGRIGMGRDDMISGTMSMGFPRHSLMILTPYDSNYEKFVKKNRKGGQGKLRARIFLEMSTAGVEMQKSIGRQLGPDIIRQYGTLMVGNKKEFEALKDEYKYYKLMGFGRDYNLVSKVQIAELYKTSVFEGGLLIPNDAIASGEEYPRILADKAGLTVAENAKVIDIKQTKTGVMVKTDSAGDITADYVVLATNGFLIDKNLRGKIWPWWTFEISYEDNGPNTPNSFDFNDDYHWFSRQDNLLFIGGGATSIISNNFRFYKYEEREKGKLIKWVNKIFPQTRGKQPVAFHFGVGAYTIDEVPIVGKYSMESRIFYIVGCNGTGQSTLSYAASLMPGIMGYVPLNDKQRRIAEFLSPTRPTLK
ncbi:MAG: FAD-binding oxidoreductase [Nanoarchaeota archaeon]